MNIVHINFLDHYGGAAIAARRLHQAMLRAGHKSRMLVWSKHTDDPTIDLFDRRTTARAFSQVVGRRIDELGLQYMFHPASMRLPDHPWVKEADVIHLHQIHGGYFSLRVLPKLAQRTPVVWTMHDMWAVTGHCAIAAYERCDRWQIGCGRCPYKDYYPSVRMDLTRLMWQVKKNLYRRARIAVVAPSRWLATQLKLSPLLSSFPIHHIPNGVDRRIFRPIDKKAAREALGIHTAKKLLMFGAASLTEPDKGAGVLLEALSSMPVGVKESVALMLVGSRHSAFADALTGFDVMPLGPVQNERLLAIAYAAADVFVLPSLAENLPNMLVESLACGAPCVAFDVGGCSEIIEHGRTGYLARAGDAQDFAHGIQTLLRDEEGHRHMAQAGVVKAAEYYDVDRQAKEYLLLYEAWRAQNAQPPPPDRHRN